MHKPLFLITAGSVAAVGALVVASAMPAGAATSVRAETMARDCSVTGLDVTSCSDNTPVTFTITSIGVLGMTAPLGTPTAVNLGSLTKSTVGGTIGAPDNFGTVAVTDLRSVDPADWTVTVYSSAFTNTTTVGAADNLPASAASYLIPSFAATTDSALTTMPLPTTTGLTPQLVNHAATFLPLSGTGQAVATETGFVGDNGAQWSPQIDITLPAATVAGTYTGTITHSVT